MGEQSFLYNKKIIILQPKDGFKSSLDTVLLGSSCHARPHENILEFGVGVGGVLLCCAFHNPQTNLYGIEKNPIYYEYAKKNMDVNNLQAHLILGDATEKNLLQQHLNKKIEFHHILMNPPYFTDQCISMNPLKACARSTVKSLISQWLRQAFKYLNNYGCVHLIYPANQLLHILPIAITLEFGAIEIIPFFSKPHTPARRILLRMYKKRKSSIMLQKGYFLHKKNGSYTSFIQKVLHGERKI